ncbi:zincin [Pluteus cervinus]|uniref:Zincin n=1 Tax=Pluteus cervinus TaxID=181527 RepID=A0ACD3BFD4_9AGAR|nr:zincin [Pluteus cervinus]
MPGRRRRQPSTDDSDAEQTPLIPDSDSDDSRPKPSLADRITSLVQEPLTPLTQVLLIVVLVLLLMSSVFIGLFAGAQHKLNVIREHLPDGGGGGSRVPITTTATATQTATATVTDIQTTIRTKTIGGGGSVTATETSTVISYTTSFTTSVTTETTTETKTRVTTTTAYPAPGPSDPPSRDLPCMSAECIVLSASVLASLDTSKDPCNDFYDYATGGWRKAHPLPADKGAFGVPQELSQQNKDIIKHILESNDYTPELFASPDQAILAKLRDMYSSCLNEDRLDDLGTAPLARFVRTLRRLYREEDTDVSMKGQGDTSKGLTAALAFLHSRGVDSLFSFNIEGDVGADPNYMVLWFSQPSFGLPSKEYYDEETVVDVYQSVIQRLLYTLDEDANLTPEDELLINNADSQTWPPWPWPPWDGDEDEPGDGGGDGPGGEKPSNRTKRARKLAEKVIKLEKRLADASLDLDILFQDPVATYNPVPLKQFTQDLPQVHFPTYFSTFTPRTYPDRVIVTYPPYVTSLSDILYDTSSDVVESYLVIRAALTLAPNLGTSSPAWQAVRKLKETLTGVKPGAYGDRSEICVGQVETTLGFAAGRYFVLETFTGDSKSKGIEIIKDIIGAFKRSLPHIDWMDKKSATAAAEKADAITLKVGYPLSPDTLDPQSIENYYSAVKVNKKTYFENVLSAITSDQFKRWLQLGRSRNTKTWEMYPSMVNAYFSPPANEIVFPAGIMRPPYFFRAWPAYMLYGAFGQAASHELTHAFDSAGRMYNQQGKLEQWWTNTTIAGFQKKQDCIIEQFSGYTVDDGKGGKIHLNGNLTSGENIGDTGLIQAYRAWKANFDSSFQEGDEFTLPGLDFTRDQLFFISFARIWAENIKPAQLVQRVRTNPHSPNRFRVEGTVFNIPEFAKAFNCPVGSKLNPPQEERCIFW